MIPISKVRDLISKHKSLEKELSSGEIDKKFFAENLSAEKRPTEKKSPSESLIYFSKTKNKLTTLHRVNT